MCIFGTVRIHFIDPIIYLPFESLYNYCMNTKNYFFSPNFFILDEPTNHLDIETVEALGKALKKFQVIILNIIEIACQ